MTKRLLQVAALTAALLMAISTVSFAGGPADKATGDITWTSAGNVAGYHQVFDAHEARDGRPAKGEVTLYAANGSKRIVNVECVLIEGNEGWFAGPITYADGDFTGNSGYVIHWVQDNATSGADGDLLGSSRYGDCGDLGTWRGGGTVTDGNLQVHAGESDA